MNEATAKQIHDKAREAFENLAEIVEMIAYSEQFSDLEAENLFRSIAGIISDIREQILAPIYDKHPNIENLDVKSEKKVILHLYQSIPNATLSVSDEVKEEIMRNLQQMMIEKGITLDDQE